MPLTKDGKPVFYKPFKSNIKIYKYSVYVKADNKKGFRKINFGREGYPDFRSGTASKEQKKSYLARSKGIKNKAGELTYNDKNSANYWSRKYGWLA